RLAIPRESMVLATVVSPRMEGCNVGNERRQRCTVWRAPIPRCCRRSEETSDGALCRGAGPRASSGTGFRQINHRRVVGHSAGAVAARVGGNLPRGASRNLRSPPRDGVAGGGGEGQREQRCRNRPLPAPG